MANPSDLPQVLPECADSDPVLASNESAARVERTVPSPSRRTVSPANTAIVCLFLLIIAFVFWPTLYRYDTLTTGTTSVPVRTHRITGVAELFNGRWMQQVTYPKAIEVPFDVLARIEGRGGFSGTLFTANLYNGSSWMISEVTLLVTAKEGSGAVRWTRTFTEKTYLKPQSNASVSVLTYESAPSADWTIASARGYQDERR